MDRGTRMSREHPNVSAIRSAYEAVERGDVPAFASVLDDDIVWHESMPGYEGDYQGSGEVLAFMGRMFEETGMEVKALTIEHVLADDTHAAVLLEVTATIDGRTRTSNFVDAYRVRDGQLTEHWHLPVDPKGEEAFYGG
jgi:ketosteroid isomerase-like protein